MLFMFLFMMPTMMRGRHRTADLDRVRSWHDELWLIERTAKVNWRDPREPRPAQTALRHVNLADLEHVGPAIPLELSARTKASLTLLALGDRLWLIGADSVGYYEHGR